MKVTFKRTISSDVYTVKDEKGKLIYKLKSDSRYNEEVWGNLVSLIDLEGNELAKVYHTIKDSSYKFDIYKGEDYIGSVTKKNLRDKEIFMEYIGWKITTDFLDRKYVITDSEGKEIATIARAIVTTRDKFVVETDEKNFFDVTYFVMSLEANMDGIFYGNE